MKRACAAAAVILGAGLWSDPAGAQRVDTVRIGTGASQTEAFVAYPAARNAAPAVIVVHEWWGLNDQIRSVARRLAAEGYVAIVPDLYHGRVTDDPEQAHVLARGIEDERARRDLDAALAWLRASPRVGDRPVGVVGFCMGGGVALDYGLHRGDLRGVVVFYGPPVTDAAQLAGLKAPLLGHFGLKDDGIPEARVNAFRDGLARAGRTAEIHTYPAAGHAFMNDARPSYQPDAAKQAWARTMAFLQKQLRDSK
jgi:carboxymethylenebutenolidase